MFSLRDLIIFFAGAEFFHTWVHLYFYFMDSFPMDFKYIVLTSQINKWGILINAMVTIVLLVWAIKRKKHNHGKE